MSAYDRDLDRNPANYQPLTPLAFLERAADVFPARPAIVHGGPYPATSDGRGTSVGTLAIDRYTRWVAYQNFPEELLPAALR